jgi:predicted ArsR family transcriptional regulator
MADTPLLPWQGVTPHSKQASYSGAVTAGPNAKNQQERILDWLSRNGPATDDQISTALGIMRSSVCARRNALMQAGLIESCGLVKGRYRAQNALWRVNKPEAA